jgi:hypothetical protein
VTTYTQAGDTATWRGRATVNGVDTQYRISVTDNGETNQGVDTFTITTDSGYSATGNVTQGNVQVHPQQLLP